MRRTPREPFSFSEKIRAVVLKHKTNYCLFDLLSKDPIMVFEFTANTKNGKTVFHIGGTMTENLFIANTPYHLFLAPVIIGQLRMKEFVIVVNNAFPLRKDNIPDFGRNCLVFLEGKYGVRGFKDVLRRRHLVNYLKKKLLELKPKAIYVFNDEDYDSQMAMYFGRRLFNSRLYYVEDGLGIYADFSLSLTRKKSMRYKLKYFASYAGKGYLYWRMRVKRHGDHPYLNGIYCLYPELVNRAVPAYRIELAERLHLLEETYENAFRSLDSAVHPSSAGTLFVLLPKCFSNSLDSIDPFIDYLTKVANNRSIMLKIHPAEPRSKMCFDRFRGLSGDLQILPQGLPAELFFLYAKCRGFEISEIVGGHTSALITARVILGQSVKLTNIAGKDPSTSIFSYIDCVRVTL